MRKRRNPRIKSIIALLLSLTIIVSICGCGRNRGTARSGSEVKFQAYYKPLTSDDIAVEGDIYYVSSQVLLTSVSDVPYEDVDKLIKGYDGEIVGYISDTGDYQIYFNDCKTFEELEQLVADLKGNALVEDASLAYATQVNSGTTNYPNDPWIDTDNPSDTSGSVWDENNPGGTNWWAEAINMPTVWSMDLSTQTVKVGIIDTMFDVTNKDLDEKIFVKTWNNPENKDGTCSVSQLYNDAADAYIQASLGGDETEIDDAEKRLQSTYHGTHVAGIIAAQANNEFGITGINKNVNLYGYAMLTDESAISDEGQWTTIFQYKCALAHLLNAGVKVINISMGYDEILKGTQDGNPYSSTFTAINSKFLESFLLKYIEAGYEFLIVKSAGNDSSSKKKYDVENDVFGAIKNEQVAQRIMIVGAAQYNAKYGFYSIASFSNIGSRVDVYAPGVDILSVMPSDTASSLHGTSMAAPIVTGLATLIWGINPDLSAEQVRSIILASTSATVFNLDDESPRIRAKINRDFTPTAIVNAYICAQLAQATIGDSSTPSAEYGTLSGVVYAITSDESEYVDINIESLMLYDLNDNLVATIPLDAIAIPVTDDDTEGESLVKLYTYSLLIEPGEYTLKAEAEGYDTQSYQITISSNEVANIDFKFINTNTENSTDAKPDSESSFLVASGVGDDKLTWVLDKDGNFTLMGRGVMENHVPAGGGAGGGWGAWVTKYLCLGTKCQYDHLDIKSIRVSTGITRIGDAAFAWCVYAESAVIEDGITTIGRWAFLENTRLTSIVIPSSVTSIEMMAFYNCNSLTDVYYAGSKKEWDKINIHEYNESLLNATIHFAE